MLESFSQYLRNIEIYRLLQCAKCSKRSHNDFKPTCSLNCFAFYNLQDNLPDQQQKAQDRGSLAEDLCVNLDILNNTEMIKFMIKYFLTVILRSTQYRSKLVAPLYNLICISIQNNILVAMFIVELFTYDHIIHELLMSVPLITFETSIASLLKKSMSQIYKYEKPQITTYTKTTLKEDTSTYHLNPHPLKLLKSHINLTQKPTSKNTWTSTLSSSSLPPHNRDHQNLCAEGILGIVKGSESDESEEEEEEGKEEVEVRAEDEPGVVEKLVNSGKDEKVYVVKDDVLGEEAKVVYKYWYKGAHDYEKVPLMIRLVNAFVHKLYECDYKKSRDYDLLNILSHAAKLSPDIRKYFLANSMVGRLLDRFYGDLSKFNDIFTDLSKIPLFVTNIP